MNAPLLVPVLADKHAKAWPKSPTGRRAEYMELANALGRPFCSDAHFAAYSAPTVPRRLAGRAPEENPGGVAMVLAIFDVDGAHHAAGRAWRKAERSKVARLIEAHPGLVAYETKGGYRIVGRLDPPFVIRAREDVRAWRARYLYWCAYLSRAYGIEADTACADWTRLYRTPRATREPDGKPEDRPIVGDITALGAWTCIPTEDDEREATRLKMDATLKRKFEDARRKWLTANPRTFPTEREPCPVCCEPGGCPCFARLYDDPGRGTCFSTDHPVECGYRSPDEVCFIFDALDIEAYRRGMSPRDLLEADGYLKRRAETDETVRTAARTTIIVAPDEARVADEAIDALSADASVYQRDGRLVRIHDDGEKMPRIERLPLPSLRERLATVTDLVQVKRTGPTPAHPPDWLVKAVDARGSWPDLRALRGVITAPAMRPDGSVISGAGYDAATGLCFQPRVTFPTVPIAPTLTQARGAVEMLAEPLCDFPFLEPADKAAALAVILSIAARPAIDGLVPLFALSANVRGCGKGLLADVLVTSATGREARLIPSPPEDNTEWRKLILTLALEAPTTVTIDNIEGIFGSAALAAALTASEVNDRLLGSNESGGGELRLVWLATGNNLTLRRDLDRRVVMIRQESPEECPEDRTGFRFPDVLGHVKQVWPQLVVAALTVVRAFHLAGRPSHGKPRLGRFEAWDDLVRGALIWAGAGDPDGARARTREESDSDRDALRALVLHWRRAFGDAEKTAHEVIAAAEPDRVRDAGRDYNVPGDPELLAALEGLVRGKLNSKSLGNMLKAKRGRVVAGFRFTSKRNRCDTLMWRLVDAPMGAGSAGSAGFGSSPPGEKFRSVNLPDGLGANPADHADPAGPPAPPGVNGTAPSGQTLSEGKLFATDPDRQHVIEREPGEDDE